MRKFLLFFIITFFALEGFAQFGKGSKLLGGSFSVGRSKQEGVNWESTNKNYYLSPSAGVAVRQNLFLGAGVTIGGSRSSGEPNTNKYQSNVKGGFLFLRSYHTLGKGFYLFAQPSVYYTQQEQRSTYLQRNDTQKSRSAGLDLYPGVAYQVNKLLQLEVGLNQLVNLSYFTNETYGVNNGVLNQSSKTKGFHFNTNIGSNNAFSVGLRVLLAK